MKKILFAFIFSIVLGCGTTQNLQDKLIAEHPEWTTEEIMLIKTNKIKIGMSKDMVLASWGEPGYVSENSSTYTGEIITWSYYKIFGTDIRSVSFQKGEVTMFNVSEPNY